MKCFIDTNVLVYRKDRSNPSKQSPARAWLEAVIANDALVLSAQSLREYYWTCVRKNYAAAANLRNEIAAYGAYVPDDLRHDRLNEAWALQDRHRLNFWDSLLIASALAAGCTIFLSEDLSGEQKISKLTIVNPFTTAPEAVFGA